MLLRRGLPAASWLRRNLKLCCPPSEHDATITSSQTGCRLSLKCTSRISPACPICQIFSFTRGLQGRFDRGSFFAPSYRRNGHSSLTVKTARLCGFAEPRVANPSPLQISDCECGACADVRGGVVCCRSRSSITFCTIKDWKRKKVWSIKQTRGCKEIWGIAGAV